MKNYKIIFLLLVLFNFGCSTEDVVKEIEVHYLNKNMLTSVSIEGKEIVGRESSKKNIITDIDQINSIVNILSSLEPISDNSRIFNARLYALIKYQSSKVDTLTIDRFLYAKYDGQDFKVREVLRSLLKDAKTR